MSELDMNNITETPEEQSAPENTETAENNTSAASETEQTDASEKTSEYTSEQPEQAEPETPAEETAETVEESETQTEATKEAESQNTASQPTPPAQNVNSQSTVPPYSYTVPPYQQQYQQQQYGSYNQYNPYQQPSQGYYQPNTNEYIYSPQPPKKKSNAGKAALIIIASMLAVFVIAVAGISAYTFINGYDFKFGTNPFADQRGDSLTTDPSEKIDVDKHAFRQDEDEEEIDDDDDDSRSVSSNKQNVASGPVQIRDFPSIEQLAAPDDAMSLPDIYDKVSPSVVGVSTTVRGGTQTGTGFVISDDGYIVTNAHVIDGYLSVMIVDSDLNEYEAEVIGSDTQTDIAVLRVDPEQYDLVPVEFGISSDLRIGEVAIAIGNPLGFELYGTITTGVISGLNREVTISDNTMTLMQTSASINNGNSGGPLIDAYGRVIGITSAKINTIYGESLGFAIPIDEAIPIVQNLIQYGYVIGRPSIGISAQDVTSLISLYYRLPQGVYVIDVTSGSGADDAGIIPGDVIIGIEGESITSMSELNNIKNKYKVGDTITLTIYRSADGVPLNGENFDVDVVLTEAAPEIPEE